MILFDDGLAELSPLTDLRPVFEVRTGALTTRERVAQTPGWVIEGVHVRDESAGLAAELLPGVRVNADPAGRDGTGPVLLLNGRCPLPPRAWVQSGAAAGRALVDRESGDLVAAIVERSQVAAALAELVASRRAPLNLSVEQTEGRALLSRPWHVRTFRDACMDLDLAALAERPRSSAAMPQGAVILTGGPIWIDPSAKVYPGTVLDAERGPIVIEAGAVVRPASSIIGPAWIGPGATVLDRAVVKGYSAIGPRCKVAGEVGGTIFQGHANKAHDGHLGDSWIGEWVNLGAGTTNSNLLNTYGEVRSCARPGGTAEPTGERFLGAIIGDHARTAIGTRIMTGAVIHAGAMIATTAAVNGCVPPFAWRTDAGADVYRLQKFLDTARVVMTRRGVVPGAQYILTLERLHAAASAARAGNAQ